MSRFVFFSLLSMLALQVGCTADASLHADHRHADALSADKGGRFELPLGSREYIKIESLERSQSKPVVRAPGRMEYRENALVQVAAPIDGRVDELFVREGEYVHAGQPLFSMSSVDAAALRADLVRAELQMAAAQERHRRYEQMFAKGVAPEIERFEAEIQVSEAKAELERMRAQASVLGKGKGDRVVVRAPADGFVVKQEALRGRFLAAGEIGLVDIGNPNSLWAVIDVGESDLGFVRKGGKARLFLRNEPTGVEGEILAVGSLRTGVRRAPVIVGVSEGAATTLRAGQFIKAEFDIEADDALFIPMEAVLVKGEKQAIVYVENGDAFEARTVVTGQSVGGRVQVLSGLEAGERLVVKGALLLDGAAEQML